MNTHRTPTLFDTGGSQATRKAELIAAGRICVRCEILVFGRVVESDDSPFTVAINQIALELEDGVLCAACVAEEKPGSGKGKYK